MKTAYKLCALFVVAVMLSGCAESALPVQHGDSDAALDGAHHGERDSAAADVNTSNNQPGDSGRDTEGGADTSTGADTSSGADALGDDVPGNGQDTASDRCAAVTCSSGVCNPADGQCVECLAHGDCAGEATCQPGLNVCIAPCCTFTASDIFSDVGYVHDRFDIAVTADGAQAVAFIDPKTNRLRYARMVANQWFSQDVAVLTNGDGDVRLALEADGTPHMILSRYQTLKHYWQDASGWHDFDIPLEGRNGQVDIVIDSANTVHMVVLVDYGEKVLYARRDAQGQRSSEYLTVPDARRPSWTNIDATRDGRPIISFQIGAEQIAVVAERSAQGAWSYQTVNESISSVHGMALDPDDSPVIVYYREPGDGLRIIRRLGTDWNTERVVAEDGLWPDITIDRFGGVHLVYMLRNPADQFDNPMHYARWNGSAWQSWHITSVVRGFFPRVTTDDLGVMHAVVYDTNQKTVSYVRGQ
ncbi:MAG: hypothetical protein H0U74_10655 [Bradymonadaceae bacterium]|nr:hypothetical protein [Lujinxingiaceae bacterium]